MSDAYRDDLDAARARVSDLEREAEQLRKRNAELEARDHVPEVKAPPAPAPEVSTTAKFMVGATRVCLVMSLCLVAGPRFHTGPYTPHWVLAGICLGLALLCWCASGFRRLWR